VYLGSSAETSVILYQITLLYVSEDSIYHRAVQKVFFRVTAVHTVFPIVSGANNISHSYSGAKVSNLHVWKRTGVSGTSHPHSVNKHRLVVL